MPSPSEHELRLRAAVRVARRRSLMVSAAVVGSLIVLNLFLYTRTHNAVWLLVDAVFVCTLSFRAWVAFSTDRKEDDKIQREMARMRHMAMPETPGQFPPTGWAPPAAQQALSSVQQAPVPPPPPTGGRSGPRVSSQPNADESLPADPWSGSWSF